MATTLLIIAAILPATDTRFAPDGTRSPNGQTLIELARLACTATPRGYSLTGQADYRVGIAQRTLDAFARYNRVPAVQYSQRCACRRIYAQLDQWSYNRQLEPPPDESFSESEMRQFKEACYLMLLAPEKWTRTRALEHLVFLADTRDAARLKALLRRPEAELDHGLICLALGRIGGEDAIPLLVKELDGRRWEEAYTAIQRIGGPKAEAALTGRKKPPDAD